MKALENCEAISNKPKVGVIRFKNSVSNRIKLTQHTTEWITDTEEEFKW